MNSRLRDSSVLEKNGKDNVFAPSEDNSYSFNTHTVSRSKDFIFMILGRDLCGLVTCTLPKHWLLLSEKVRA